MSAKRDQERKKTYVRTTPHDRAALRVVIAAVANAAEAEDLDVRTSQEAIVTASWRWMADLAKGGGEGLLRQLRPYLLDVSETLGAGPGRDEPLGPEELPRVEEDEDGGSPGRRRANGDGGGR